MGPGGCWRRLGGLPQCPRCSETAVFRPGPGGTVPAQGRAACSSLPVPPPCARGSTILSSAVMPQSLPVPQHTNTLAHGLFLFCSAARRRAAAAAGPWPHPPPPPKLPPTPTHSLHGSLPPCFAKVWARGGVSWGLGASRWGPWGHCQSPLPLWCCNLTVLVLDCWTKMLVVVVTVELVWNVPLTAGVSCCCVCS